MTQINFLLPAPLVEALGWTLLHSLWQGAVLALLLLLLLFSMRKSSAQKRYLLAVATLLLFLGSSLSTFVWSYQKAQAQAALPTDTALEYMLWQPELPTDLAAETASPTSRWEIWQAYFEQHSPWIVSAWLVGVGLLALRFLGGIVYLQRLRHRQNQPVAAFWQERSALLAKHLGLRRKVQLLESALVQVPMVIGALKPVVLLPLGLLSGLPTTQVEAVLVHELAHIRRHDYLINLLQSLVEILFFFNPFVWWVAAKIRQERENCCDDEALRITGDALAFAKILLHLEASRLQQPALAMALAGQKGALRQRIERMLGQKSCGAGLSGGFWAATLLLFCLGLAFYQGKALERQDTLGLEETSVLSPAEGLEETPEATTQRTKKPALSEKKTLGDTLFFGKNFKYKIIFSDTFKGEMDFYDGDKKVKKEDYHLYKDFFTINEDGSIRFAPEMGTIRYSQGPKQKAPLVFPYEGLFIDSLYGMKFTPLELFPNDSLFRMKFTPLELPEGLTEMMDAAQAKKDREQALKDMEQAQKDLEQAQKDLEQAQKDLEQAQKDIELAKRDMVKEKQDKQTIKEMERAKEELEKAKQEMERGKQEMERSKQEMERSKQEMERNKQEMERNKKENDLLWKELREELIKDGYLKNMREKLRVDIGPGNVISINKQVLSPVHQAKYLQKFPQIMTYETKSEKWVEKENPHEENAPFWRELQEELVKDGYVKDTKVIIREIVVGDTIRVNGVTIRQEHDEKYRKKLEISPKKAKSSKVNKKSQRKQ